MRDLAQNAEAATGTVSCRILVTAMTTRGSAPRTSQSFELRSIGNEVTVVTLLNTNLKEPPDKPAST